MSNAKEIRGQIKSVKNTQKITKAMEMVAASKVRRVQEHMRVSRPYTDNILRVIGHLMNASSHTQHPFLVKPEKIEKVGYILVSTDRGLCGGLNINLFKLFLKKVQEDQAAGRKIIVSVFGRKGVSFLTQVGIEILSTVENYPEMPEIQHIIGGALPMIRAFQNNEVQQVKIVSNYFVNAMTQEPRVEQLLPASINHDDGLHAKEHSWDYLYEPSPEAILDKLLRRYIESTIKQAVLENIASEMSARMIAMKNASDNAGNLISELQLKYNKARQAAITQELTEIVAGADAV
ncbi:F0F1 ATP synthase subunit gamma [Suttonella ornithocola]|uniref:ATP synthase gamma chain n=1 Tax=Suttonella ornithocola TaxID=279832 RepID=A0A380MTU8_9GAMM|nr:F0F1 ATP synthase subunit gamma [Suttonella ornithocola]SUO96020.1 F-ATPase gamma subunit [Suttonella ornithocola]